MSTENVSWNKPFGNSAASNLVGGGGGISNMFQGVSMAKPLGTESWMADAVYGNPDAPLTPDGKDKKTGEQVIIPGTGGSSSTNDPQFGGTIISKPPSLSGGINSITSPVSPRSAMALEERLRSSKRSNLTPNVEFGFNLEKNPIAASAVRPSPTASRGGI